MSLGQIGQVGRYKLLERLGSGAMGEVYRAHDPVLDRQVAIKFVILPDVISQETSHRRFQREVQAVARLNHPHIVTVYDVVLEDPRPYVVMELLTEGTLRAYLRQQSLRWQELLLLLRPLVQALGYAHRVGIIHRDVKPANVMLTQNKLSSTPQNLLKLTDFGLARWQGEEVITQLGEIVGTLAYMSPEQANGQIVDARTDIFSFGVLLFEAISGHNPLAKGSLSSSIAEIRSLEPIDLSPLYKNTSQPVIRLIEQALAKDRERRYPTCEVLLADLDRCLEEGEARDLSLTHISSWPPLKAASGQPAIQKGSGIELTAEIEHLLRLMFRDASRIALEREFNQGLGSGRVFRVRPVDATGRAQLPTVVKIAPVNLIRQEWQAYQEWVDKSLPGAAHLEAAPTLPPGSLWDGLRYSLIGQGAFEVQSLYRYYHQASIKDLWWIITERLSQLMGAHWWAERQLNRVFQMQPDYDHILPVNLLLKPTAFKADADIYQLTTEQQLPPAQLTAGDRIQLNGFVVTELAPNRQQATLNLGPVPSATPPKAYRLRLTDCHNIEQFRLGQVVNGLTGTVVATRQDLLVTELRQALGPAIDLSADQVSLAQPNAPAGMSQIVLPNPLQSYQTLLTEFLTVNIATIHGDLNLENILIDPDTRHISFIDFATVRQGHVLHDLLRLETEVVTKLLAVTLAEEQLPATTIYTLYHQLHHTSFYNQTVPPFDNVPPVLRKSVGLLAAIRKMAWSGLFKADDWTEYYRGLIIYLLGALKFKNLDKLPGAPHPKQVAFWGAATLSQAIRSVSERAVSHFDQPPSVVEPVGYPPEIEVKIPEPRPTQPSAPKVGGDTMQGAKVSGDQITVGNISGSNIAIGAGAQVSVGQTESGEDKVAQLFEAILHQIEHRSDDEHVEKEEIIEFAVKIRREITKGGEANPVKVERWLNSLIDIAPDVSKTITTGLSHPLPGVSDPIRQLAAKVDSRPR